MGEDTDVGDATLVHRAARGDEDAYAELVRRYQRAAFGLALSVTGRHQDAEDATQEAFIVALERLEECRNPDRFAGWFLTIVRNRARNVVRREVMREGDVLPFGLADAGPGPDRQAERMELRETLMTALSELPETQRKVVLLHDLEGWKHREIAEKLNLPPGTVRSHLFYARKRLRAILKTTFGHESREVEG